MTDFGTTYFCVDDFADDFRVISGPAVVSQHVYHLLTTDALVDVDQFGDDVRKYVATITDQSKASALQYTIISTAQRDPRVETCDATVTLLPSADFSEPTIRIEVSGQSALGPFSLVMQANSVTVAILAPVPPPETPQ